MNGIEKKIGCNITPPPLTAGERDGVRGQKGWGMDVFEKCVKVNEQVREVYDSGNYFFFRKLESAQDSEVMV
ncbi:MAG: hypothetical protein QME90_19860, partial [Thermodesulfobacteriota bacterium]|nr:hypothetical protein [Thermodesulfobacteriota bacterium]